MSRYQLGQTGWNVGAVFIPVGTILDDVAGQDDFSKLIRAKQLLPPLNAVPLDQATYNLMQAIYGGRSLALPTDQQDMTRWIVTPPGIVR